MISDEENKKRLAQTLHHINTASKRCLVCLTVRPADVYRCPSCGKISTVRA